MKARNCGVGLPHGRQHIRHHGLGHKTNLTPVHAALDSVLTFEFNGFEIDIQLAAVLKGRQSFINLAQQLLPVYAFIVREGDTA